MTDCNSCKENPEKFYSIKEAAALLGLRYWHLQRAVKGLGSSTKADEQSIASIAVQLASHGAELFHDLRDRTFISIRIDGGGISHLKLDSEEARHFIRRKYFAEFAKPLHSAPLQQAIETLKARAYYSGIKCQVAVRMARHDDDIRRYELKLVIHTMFTLNYDFVDEEEFGEDQRKRLRDLLCATAESLALATKSEIEIESRLKSEDGAPMQTAVVANLQEAAALAASPAEAIAAE